MEVDLILAGIIVNELGINPARVVVYNQNWEPPADDDLYIILSTGQFTPLGVTNRYDPDTDEEVKSVTGYTEIAVELTSKSREALEKKEYVLMALVSGYSVRQQEDNQIKIFRSGDILDLSFIEGSSALHRFRIPVRISSVKTVRTAIEPIDKFREPEVTNE